MMVSAEKIIPGPCPPVISTADVGAYEGRTGLAHALLTR